MLTQNKTMLKKDLQNIFAKNRISQVIAKLIILTKDSPDIHNEVLQISARYEHNDKQRRLDIIDNNAVNLENNKIRNALILIIEQLPDEIGIDSSQNNPFFLVKYILFIAFILFFALIIFTYLKPLSTLNKQEFTNKPNIETGAFQNFVKHSVFC